MASDVVEFQRQTFLTTFEEVKPTLPDTLVSEFEQIKKCIEEDAQVKKNVWSNSHASTFLVPWFNDLNDALAECTVFADQCQEVTQSLSRLYSFHQTLFIRSMKQTLKTLNDKFGQLITMLILEFRISSSSPTRACFPTDRYTSFESISDSQLLGFDEQEKEISDLICGNSYKAIGVYGMAGSGKTALILNVLNNPSVRNQFSPIIWLCLSDIHSKQDAEYEVNIVKFILCELGCDVDKWTVTNPTKADLLKHLKKLLVSNKFLIVFDDVWENHEFYSNLGDALPLPLPGSDIVLKNQLWEALPRDGGGKIIVTSRQKEVVKNMVGEKNLMCMKPLSRESCKMILEEEIFTEYAEKIEGWLNGNNGFVSIGIHGPNSSANNALVRMVLRSTSVGEKFEHIIWVPVSLIFLKITEIDDLFNFGDEIIMEHVLKELGCDDDKMTKDKINSYELREMIKKSLGSKKYLIVLADVVCENYDFWGAMCSLWRRIGNGTIIVTCNLEDLIDFMVMGDNLVHVRLPELASIEGTEVTKYGDYVSDDIVDQCCGLPFAAKTLGKIIREKGHQLFL